MTRGRIGRLLLLAACVVGAGVAVAVVTPIAGGAVLGGAMAVAGVGAAAAVAVGWSWLARSNPRLDGDLTLSGLDGAVTIRRNPLGTPYVDASSDRDAAFGLGVAMAQDRLWQMDLLRRSASGRLAEVAGAEAFALDRYVRTIGLRRIAESEEGQLGPEERTLLEGFSAGVNAVIGGRLGGTAFEFRLLRYKPDEWRVSDTLAVAKAFGWLLSSSLEASALEWRVSARLGPDLAALLFGADSAEPAHPTGPGWAGPVDLDRSLRDSLGGPARTTGSNVWAVAGRHTRSGRPILANDIHLGLEYSLRLYEARVDGCSLHVTGLFVPGAPLPVAGTTGSIAWGPTNTGVAVSDLYVESLSDDGREVRHGDRWEPVRELIEEIAVRGAEPRRIVVRHTRHGPIVSDLVPAAAPGPGTALALRWAGSECGPPARAVLELARATDWAGFNAACDLWSVPATTIGYADVEGHIGLRVAGALPIRPRVGLLPLDGTDADCEWEGYVPASVLPRVIDPEAGWVAAANDAPGRPGDPYRVTWLPEPPYRIRRIRELLAQLVERGRGLTVEEMAVVQRDVVSRHALEQLPRMLAALDRSALERAETDALEHLEDWNANVTLDSVAATIWEAWSRRWLGDLLRERLEPDEAALALEIPRLNPGGVPWALADRPALDAWCTSRSATDLIRGAFRGAVAELRAGRGADPSRWDWGSLHGATWAHPAGRSRLLGWLLNRGPYPMHGDAMTVNAAEFRLAKPYAVTLLAASRLVVDLGEADAPRVATHPGQSAHPLSPHYDDRIGDFRRGILHVTPDRLAAEDARHTLRLRPA